MMSGPVSDLARATGARRLVALGACLASFGGTGLFAPGFSRAQQPQPPVAPTPTGRPADLRPPAAEPTPVSPAEESAMFQAISGEVATIFERCKGAVVRIQATDLFGRREGTGFFIDPSGTIYTHCSVAGHSWNVTVEFGDKKYPAKTLVSDPRSGVIILKIDAGAQTPFLTLGRSSDLRVASPIIAIGYPEDLPASPTFGLVAGFDQRCPGGYLPTTHIRANVPVQSGEQGSPLLNAHGEVVGILVCQFDYGAVCLGLPIQAAEKVRADYMRFGEPRPGWLGVTAVPINGDEDHDAVKIADLAEDTPAAQCGLKEGDVLMRVGHTPIRHFADLPDAAFFLTAGEKVPITVLRGDQEVTVEVRAANPPGFRPDQTAGDGGVELGTRVALPAVPR